MVVMLESPASAARSRSNPTASADGSTIVTALARVARGSAKRPAPPPMSRTVASALRRALEGVDRRVIRAIEVPLSIGIRESAVSTGNMGALMAVPVLVPTVVVVMAGGVAAAQRPPPRGRG